ncbi:cytochrome P450 3A41-like isoform X2 [Centruroides sculpturatus]|uniref:cytochrome P450 3A41-like isoform X2 n=1 Tax=Centruroides sculpturatus TaxID=218467 RepID=UPI000C6E8D14|nr:cytochrome P450 3A41-like isoform X2 [Centruroides sculpturatus]
MQLFEIFNYKWFIFIVLVLLLSVSYVNRYFNFWEKHGIPSPTTNIWSFLTGLYQFINKPLHLLQVQTYNKCGRIYGIFFGLKPQLVVADPQIVKNILVKDFNMFHNRMKFKIGNPVFDNMLSVLADEDWKRIRCIMSPTFTSSRMRKMAYLIRECAEKFTENLKNKVPINENQTLDCKSYLSTYPIDVIASTAFGTKLNSLEDPNNEFVNKARQASNTDASLRLTLFFLFPKLIRFLKVDIFGGAFDFFQQFALHVVKRREEEKMKANDFLQLLMDAQKGILEISPEDSSETNDKDESNFKTLPKHKTMSLDEMLAQCVLFLFAGIETTTNTLAFVVYYMALNPECQNKLIEEIDEVNKNNKEINFDVLFKMQYMDAVVNESFRKEPIGIQLMRECTEEYEISEIGFKIPKGMTIAIPIYSMHHDKEFYPNPEKFDPERFLPENRHSILPYTYLPFGEGPRNCIGMRFAIMVVKMFIFHLFRDFRVHATEETKKPLEFFRGQGLIQPKKVIVELERRK